MKQTVRVAGGQGFWGDLLTAPIDQVRRGPIDYLMLDYLAEVTMSILQKQRSRDPNAGYARDFVALFHHGNKGEHPEHSDRDLRLYTPQQMGLQPLLH